MLEISPKVYFFNPLLYQLSYRAKGVKYSRTFPVGGLP
jgi:hypothetical protein